MNLLFLCSCHCTFPHILSCAWYILPFWLNKPRRFSSRSPYLRNLPRILSPISSLCGLVWYPVHTSVIALSLQCTDSFLLVLPSQLDYLRVRPCQWYWHIALTGCLTHSRYLIDVCVFELNCYIHFYISSISHCMCHILVAVLVGVIWIQFVDMKLWVFSLHTEMKLNRSTCGQVHC